MDNALKCSIPLFKRRKPSTNFMDVISHTRKLQPNDEEKEMIVKIHFKP